MLTAYHCYDDEPGKEVGAGRLRPDRARHQGRRDEDPHLETDGVDDVALFRLAEPVKAPHIKLADTDPCKGAVVNIYGYGSFGKYPKNLRKATVRVTGVKHDAIVGRAIWTKKLSGDTEPGDSGGPAFYKGKQVGVLFGPNEYSSVASHRGWIKKATGV